MLDLQTKVHGCGEETTQLLRKEDRYAGGLGFRVQGLAFRV